MLQRFDSGVTSLVTSLPAWVSSFMHSLAYIGHPALFLVIAGGIIFIGITQHLPRLIVAGGVLIATIATSSLLKVIVHRERPVNDYTKDLITLSFPSGHATASFIGCGIIAYFLWARLPNIYGVIAALVVMMFGLLVGISRIYVGAHYPSDVIGGWLLGAIALAIIIFIVRP